MNGSLPLSVPQFFPLLEWENVIYQRFCKDLWKTVYSEVARPGGDLAVLSRFSLESAAGEEAEEKALGAAHGAAEPGGPAAAGEAEGLRGAHSAGGTSGPTWRCRLAGCVLRQRPLLLLHGFHRPGGRQHLLRRAKGTMSASLPGPFIIFIITFRLLSWNKRSGPISGGYLKVHSHPGTVVLAAKWMSVGS